MNPAYSSNVNVGKPAKGPNSEGQGRNVVKSRLDCLALGLVAISVVTAQETAAPHDITISADRKRFIVDAVDNDINNLQLN